MVNSPTVQSDPRLAAGEATRSHSNAEEKPLKYAVASPLSPTGLLSDMGVSIWLADLSRDAMETGSLAQLIHTRNVVGATTTPSLLARAVAGTDSYARQLRLLAERRFSVVDAIVEITTTDIIKAATDLHPAWARTGGLDGRVSVEVDPALAHDAAATFMQARALRDKINRPNVMVEIPATGEGLQAITAAIAVGISVNVTLLFSIHRYREVIRAYLRGLELAEQNGLDLSSIYSVASFLVSRIDTEVENRLGLLDTPEADELRGTVGVANARLAYRVYQEEFSSIRACRLLAHGAHSQRPLWTSTGVKDPDLRDTYYVEELIVPGTVSTMTEATLTAVADHGVIASDTITGHYDEAEDTLLRLQAAGISYNSLTAALERDGLRQLAAARHDLYDSVETAM